MLLDHVEGQDLTEEEVGQRIMTALKQEIGPSWVLYNLAGLYWRIIGNNYQGVECVRRALYFAPDQYRWGYMGVSKQVEHIISIKK